MDAAGWWNTLGVLGRDGAAVYQRGVPRTHFFARVRVVTAVARDRSAALYPAPGAATLWELPPPIERALAFQERAWAASESNAATWTEFEEALASPPVDEGLLAWLRALDLLDSEVASRVPTLKVVPGGNAVEVPGPVAADTVQLLAGAHARSSAKDLKVPVVAGGLERVDG